MLKIVASITCLFAKQTFLELDLFNPVQSSDNQNTNSECYPFQASYPLDTKQNESMKGKWVHQKPCSCMATSPEFGFWQASFDGTYTVKQVQILTRNDNSDRVENVSVYIGDVLCTNTGSKSLTGHWLTLNCMGDGATGESIKLQKQKKEVLSFCGIRVFAQGDDSELEKCNQALERDSEFKSKVFDICLPMV